jgi:ABC-type transporter MlaC component
MKRFLCASVLALATVSLPSGQAQDSSPADQQQQQVLALVQEIKAQQAQITDNQTKIDSRIADVMEQIRLARILAARTGK